MPGSSHTARDWLYALLQVEAPRLQVEVRGKQMEVPSQEEPSNPEIASFWSQVHHEAMSSLPGFPF